MITILFCGCGWKSEPNVGMANQCPDCGIKHQLRYVEGTEQEITEYFKEKR